MSEITFDVTEFRQMFSEFSDAVRFSDTVLQSYFTQATCYMVNQVSNSPADCLTRECRTLALHQLTAHLCKSSQSADLGKTSEVTTSATVGSVSVGTTPPPFGQSTWAYWLSTTAYGQALLVLLRSCTNGGAYLGGRCERAAFRKVGGRF